MERREFIIRTVGHPALHLGTLRARGWRLESFRTVCVAWLRARHSALVGQLALRRDEVVTLLACVKACGG
jgi:hypothetical protein